MSRSPRPRRGRLASSTSGDRLLGGGWIIGTGRSARARSRRRWRRRGDRGGGLTPRGRMHSVRSFLGSASPGIPRLRCPVTEPRLITESAPLAALCAAWRGADFVTVDTEFMRESTYRAKLCLVQVGAPGGEEAAVDPLAPGIDLAPLYDLLVRAPVLKVFHAARQDVEVILQLAGAVPNPLFDTQVAAMVCGFGEQVGYETLVAKLAHGRIDKTQRFTDWSRRPLTERQLLYALSDVSHLRIVYEKLVAELERTGPAVVARRGACRAHRPRHLRSSTRGRVAADQGARRQPALPGDPARARGLARNRGGAPRQAPGMGSEGHRAQRDRGAAPAHGGRARQAALGEPAHRRGCRRRGRSRCGQARPGAPRGGVPPTRHPDPTSRRRRGRLPTCSRCCSPTRAKKAASPGA